MEVRNALFSRNSSRRRRRPDCATTPLRARDPAGRPGTRAMFSTRRRRRALVLVGIGYVGVPVAHVPRVESFNGSTFPPHSGPLWGRSHVTDARVDFSALSRDAHASSPSITPLDARAARARRWRTARASRTSPASRRRTRGGMPSRNRKRPPPRGRVRSERPSRRSRSPGRRHPRDRRRALRRRRHRARPTTGNRARRRIGCRRRDARSSAAPKSRRRRRRRRTTTKSRPPLLNPTRNRNDDQRQGTIHKPP